MRLFSGALRRGYCSPLLRIVLAHARQTLGVALVAGVTPLLLGWLAWSLAKESLPATVRQGRSRRDARALSVAFAVVIDDDVVRLNTAARILRVPRHAGDACSRRSATRAVARARSVPTARRRRSPSPACRPKAARRSGCPVRARGSDPAVPPRDEPAARGRATKRSRRSARETPSSRT